MWISYQPLLGIRKHGTITARAHDMLFISVIYIPMHLPCFRSRTAFYADDDNHRRSQKRDDKGFVIARLACGAGCMLLHVVVDSTVCGMVYAPTWESAAPLLPPGALSRLQKEASNRQPHGSTATAVEKRGPVLHQQQPKSFDGQSYSAEQVTAAALEPGSVSCVPAVPVSKLSQPSQLRYLSLNTATGGHFLTAGSRSCDASTMLAAWEMTESPASGAVDDNESHVEDCYTPGMSAPGEVMDMHDALPASQRPVAAYQFDDVPIMSLFLWPSMPSRMQKDNRLATCMLGSNIL